MKTGMETTLELFKALSDKNRLRIVAGLSRYDELCACQITELLEVAGATASRHLRVLQHAGLVTSRKEGRWVYFQRSVPAGAEPVIGLLEARFGDSAEFLADRKALDDIVAVSPVELCRAQRGGACGPK